MAWIATVRIDTDKTTVGAAVGDATAVFDTGLADEFTYTGRIEQANPGAFVTAAKAAQVAYAARRAKEATFGTNLTNLLNA